MVTLAAGVAGATMIAVGSDLIVPIGAQIGGLLDISGIASLMLFLGLTDGA